MPMDIDPMVVKGFEVPFGLWIFFYSLLVCSRCWSIELKRLACSLSSHEWTV